MWVIDEIATRRKWLHFPSAGLESLLATQLFADGELLANAVERTAWSAPRAQPIVCGCCGYEGCEPGGWVAPRSAGEHVLLLPDFESMGEGNFEALEYAPPRYMGSRGVPLVRRRQWDRLRALVAGLPAPEALRPVSGVELARLLQWDAPGHVLGRFPYPIELRSGAVLAVSHDFEPSEAIDQVAALIDALASASDVDVRWDVQDMAPLLLYLDEPGVPGWAPALIDTEGRWHPSPAPGCAVTI